MTPTAGDARRIAILIPVYDDWDSAQVLVGELDKACAEEPREIHLIFVDDGSPSPVPGGFPGAALKKISSVRVLRLRRNLGHQRAITIGITFVAQEFPCAAVVVMDGDGEDRPEDALRLLRRSEEVGGDPIVFAARTRRPEGLVFTVFYRLYQLLHRILVGLPVRVGNFCAIPWSRLDTLSCVSELWLHFAAGIYKCGVPRELVPTARGVRYRGKSKMNFIRLVTHGLAAISVFSDLVGVRVLVATCSFSLLALLLTGVAVGMRFYTEGGIPSWAASVGGILLLFLLQFLMLASIFVSFILSSRNNLSFLPLKEYRHFIAGVTELERRHG
jgi:polyisoprenyl-phosphate glycosyltransferase